MDQGLKHVHPIYKRDEVVEAAIERKWNYRNLFEKIEQPSIWSQLLVGAFPIIIITRDIFFFLYETNARWYVRQRRGPMSFGKEQSKANGRRKGKNKLLNDVAGCEEAKQDVQELSRFFEEILQNSRKLGGKIPRGVSNGGPSRYWKDTSWQEQCSW